MREIKFRGKKIDGEWYYGDLIKETREFNRTCDKVYILPYWATLNGPIFVDKETVGQYTGLKDTNGVEIYNGDITKGLNRLWEVVVVENVHYLNGCFMFGNYNAHEFLNKHQNIEVIGNIYENLELLEGE